MNETTIDLSAEGDSTYRATMPSLDGHTTVTLRLPEVGRVSDGRLPDDEPTARATITFLLEHQDPADLPQQVDFVDVVAAYDDAVDRILKLRG